MVLRTSSMNTDSVAPRDRPSYWCEWIDRLFHGLKSDQYGDTDFDGRMTAVHAGDLVLTRLEANRHRVTRSASTARSSEIGYLKIVAPFVGCAGVEQNGRETWVTPDQWSIYDTTDSYAVANPVRVEHLIVMLPKERLTERGLALDPLMARRLGGSGGVARLALDTMRSAHRELPGMTEAAARGVGDAITQLVHLSMPASAKRCASASSGTWARTWATPSSRSTRSRARSAAAAASSTTPSPKSPTAWPATSCAGGWIRAGARSTTARAPTARSPTSRSRSAFPTWRISAACSAPTSGSRRATTGARR